ncbi:hypothetical protein [Streptomyces californicus]|uniref:hypothetical protein n=1 Tax=Streptomyces californicus TaxID=67351 RepID=UPI0033DE74E2
MREIDDAVPAPTPGDTARLDQLAAQSRDLQPEERQALADAADALLKAPTPAHAEQLFASLKEAGFPTNP